MIKTKQKNGEKKKIKRKKGRKGRERLILIIPIT